MELFMLIFAIVFFIWIIKKANSVSHTQAFKDASPEEQQQMLMDEQKEKIKKVMEAKGYTYNDDEDIKTNQSSFSSSSSSSSSFTHSNPSTGLPMYGGVGGVDSSGTPYGL